MITIDSDFEPIPYEDGSLAAPGDAVNYRLGLEEIPGWLALDPKSNVFWTGDFGIRYQGRRFVFVGEEKESGEIPPIYTLVRGKVSPRPAKKPPKEWIGSDGFLTSELYTAQMLVSKTAAKYVKTAKIHGVKRGDGSSVGLFIPLPRRLARKFPSLHPEDSSPSHVTLMFLGEIKDPAEQKRLVQTLQKEMGSWWDDATATLGPMGIFENDGNTIPHAKVDFDRDFRGLRSKLKVVLESAGFPVDSTHADYKPHVTMGYFPSGEWDQDKVRVPTGTWTFDCFEVWGLPKVYRIPFNGGA